jgi:pilus assembly protein CpaE
MSERPIRTLVLLADGISRASVEPAFSKEAGVVATFVENVDDDWQLPGRTALDVLIVACADSSERTLGLISRVKGNRPQLPVVVCQLATGETNGFLQQVFEAGAEDLVTLPEDPARVVEALRKALARKRIALAGTEEALGKLISVVGPKGGTGKTVTTTNLTAALAGMGRRTVVVDLDLSFGDVALGLRLTPERTIHDLARMGGSLDAEKVEAYLTEHDASGARALLAPIRPDHAGTISAEFLSQVFAVLRETHDFVVVDTPAGFAAEVIAAVDSSTDVCMVGMLDAFSLKDTKLGLETLTRMRYDSDKVRIVLNRADSHVGITADDVTAILGRAPDVLVPSERQISRSISDGVPIVLSKKGSPASRAFVQLAQLYMQPADGAGKNGGPPHRRGLMRRR